jgi:hypothetical protein
MGESTYNPHFFLVAAFLVPAILIELCETVPGVPHDSLKEHAKEIQKNSKDHRAAAGVASL